MDTDWTRDLKPDEAQAALDVLKTNKTPVTAREATELLKLGRALQAKADRREPECVPAPQGRRTTYFVNNWRVIPCRSSMAPG
jgi:hypothetical protein